MTNEKLGYLKNLLEEVSRASIPSESIQLLINSLSEKINKDNNIEKRENLLILIDRLEDLIDAEVSSLN